MNFVVFTHPDGQRIEFDAREQKLTIFDDEGGSIAVGVGIGGLFELSDTLESLGVALTHWTGAQE